MEIIVLSERIKKKDSKIKNIQFKKKGIPKGLGILAVWAARFSA